ncbi:MAG: glycosyltransferase [Candidatus Eiseniibacteriota bacterium]
MRILHVDPAKTWRGGERQVFLLARELERRGHSNRVACHPRGELRARLVSEGLAVDPLPIAGDLDVSAALRTGRLLRRHRPDILHLHTARAHGACGLGARLAGFHPILVTRRLELSVRGGWFGRGKYARLADHFVAISSAVEDSLVRAGVPPDRVDRIPDGVDLPDTKDPAVRPQRPWTVGTLAAFTDQKDPETWLETIRQVADRLPQARFVWAGEGELRARVEVGIRQAGLAGRVELPGFVDPDSVWPRIDVLFLPSAFEALGSVTLDAMARGLPVVATAVGGIPEVVRHEREGLLAPRGDAGALARELLRLAGDGELARRLGAAGRVRAREFEIGRVVDRIVDLYGRLAEQHGGARS